MANGDGIPATSANLTGPFGISLDAAGNLLIAEFSSSRVRRVDVVSGAISPVAGTGISGYNGDGTGWRRAERRSRAPSRPTVQISTVAGTGTPGYNGDGIAATSVRLNLPAHIDIDLGGNLLIADRNVNDRVREVAGKADLAITMSGSPNPVNAGIQFTYEITVTNNGPELAPGVTLRHVLLPGSTVVSAQSTLGSCSGTQSVGCDSDRSAAQARRRLRSS